MNPSKSQQKGKRGKTKHLVVKKQATVRKAEKGKGKDYGWLDFLGLPKMKLPDFLDFSSEKKKAPRASDAAPQSGGEKVFTKVSTFPPLQKELWPRCVKSLHSSCEIEN